MDVLIAIVGILAGVALGLLVGVLRWRLRAERMQGQLTAAVREAELSKQSEEQLRNSIQSMAADALRANNESFLQLAEQRFGLLHGKATAELDKQAESFAQLVKPVKDGLRSVGETLERIEKERTADFARLSTEITQLGRQTGDLANALKRPAVRGRWGEIQLRRVVEMAGMLPHCDFHEQPAVDEPGSRLRPDMTVNLVGGKKIVVDAKVPMDAFLSAVESQSEDERLAKLKDHVRQTREHVIRLSSKEYWQQFDAAPDLVVMFIPNDAMYVAALDQEVELMEWAAERKVFIASPITLISVLKAVALGWREEKLAADAALIAKHGNELYSRLATFMSHFNQLGKRLTSAVGKYNDSIGSLQRSVLPTARRFPELLSNANAQLDEPEEVLATVRELAAPEMTSSDADGDATINADLGARENGHDRNVTPETI